MADTPSATPAASTPEAASQNQGGVEQNQKSKIEFTSDQQTQINNIIQERLARQETQFNKKVTDLGFKSFDELSSKLTSYTTEIQTKTSESESLKLENAKYKALLKIGCKPEQAEIILGRIQGKTPEEVEQDVLKLKDLGWIGAKETPVAAQGSEQVIVSNTSKKTWKKSEISKMSQTELQTNLAELNAAQKEGRIDYTS